MNLAWSGFVQFVHYDCICVYTCLFEWVVGWIHLWFRHDEQLLLPNGFWWYWFF